MTVQVFHQVPSEAIILRTTVFVEEQGFVDEIDAADGIASHLVLFTDAGVPIATCRVFPTGNDGEYALGRFCVSKEYRGRCVGRRLLDAAEAEVVSQNGKRLVLHSQLQAKGFYEKCGYVAEGEIEYEQGHPHVFMRKILD